MALINASYKISGQDLVYQDQEGKVKYQNNTETERILSQKIEHEYIKNRKQIILTAVEQCKTSNQLFKAASLLFVYFACTSTYNILYTLGNPGASMITSPFFVSNIVSLLGTLGLNAASNVYKKAARRIFKNVDQTDTFMKLKEEFNSDEVKRTLEINNPLLFASVRLSKLEQPINLNIYNQMTSKDKEVATDIAQIVKDNKPVDKDIEIVDIFEVENRTIPDAIKIKRLYTK